MSEVEILIKELSKLKKKRTGHRNVVFKRLERKFSDIINPGIDKISEEECLQLVTVLETLREKERVLKELDERIIDLVDDDDIESEVDLATQFETDLKFLIQKVKKVLLKVEQTQDGMSLSSSKLKTGVKLPKLVMKTFSGDPLEWMTFKETFEATVDSNDNISDIEKFTYLQGFLKDVAGQCIKGFPLTGDN